MYTNTDDYIKYYNSLAKILTKQYGDPVYDDAINWKNEKSEYKKKNDLSSALLVGDCYYAQTWENTSTQADVSLFSEDGAINFFVDYSSKFYTGPKTEDNL